MGVFAALSRGSDATLIDERLFLPEDWTRDAARCQAAGIPEARRSFQRKTDLALAMIVHARQQGIGFAWVGFDGFYGSDPAFLRALEAQGAVFVGDVHKEPADVPGGSVTDRPTARASARSPAAGASGADPRPAGRPLGRATTPERLATRDLAGWHERRVAGGDASSPGLVVGW